MTTWLANPARIEPWAFPCHTNAGDYCSRPTLYTLPAKGWDEWWLGKRDAQTDPEETRLRSSFMYVKEPGEYTVHAVDGGPTRLQLMLPSGGINLAPGVKFTVSEPGQFWVFIDGPLQRLMIRKAGEDKFLPSWLTKRLDPFDGSARWMNQFIPMLPRRRPAALGWDASQDSVGTYTRDEYMWPAAHYGWTHDMMRLALAECPRGSTQWISLPYGFTKQHVLDYIDVCRTQGILPTFEAYNEITNEASADFAGSRWFMAEAAKRGEKLPEAAKMYAEAVRTINEAIKESGYTQARSVACGFLTPPAKGRQDSFGRWWAGLVIDACGDSPPNLWGTNFYPTVTAEHGDLDRLWADIAIARQELAAELLFMGDMLRARGVGLAVYETRNAHPGGVSAPTEAERKALHAIHIGTFFRAKDDPRQATETEACMAAIEAAGAEVACVYCLDRPAGDEQAWIWADGAHVFGLAEGPDDLKAPAWDAVVAHLAQPSHSATLPPKAAPATSAPAKTPDQQPAPQMNKQALGGLKRFADWLGTMEGDLEGSAAEAVLELWEARS